MSKSNSPTWDLNFLKSRTIPDPRGNLGEISDLERIFPIKRAYWITVEINAHRGFHAHKELSQLLIVLTGTISLRLDSLTHEANFILSAGENILIKPGVWREFEAKVKNTSLLVLASENFDESDYIRNYEDFRKWKNEIL